VTPEKWWDGPMTEAEFQRVLSHSILLRVLVRLGMRQRVRRLAEKAMRDMLRVRRETK